MQTQRIAVQRQLGPWTWFTYPHTNGFLRDGRRLVFGRFKGQRTEFVLYDLASEEQTVLASFASSGAASGDQPEARWFDISLATDRLLTVVDRQLIAIDLAGSGEQRVVHEVPPGVYMDHVPSITADGTHALIGERHPDGTPWGRTRAGILTIATGAIQWRTEVAWHCDHFQLCPGDESWFGFAHEGSTETVADRTWGWHAQHAPEGDCLFAQRSDDPAIPLCVGHERWCFDRAALVTVAYGASDAGPRGIWEIDPVTRAARLASAGERDWHVNVSRDGRTAIVDTTGSLDCPGRGWQNNDGLSDVVLVDLRSGVRSHLARLNAGARKFTAPRNHPWHPHPHLGPDGHWATFNDFQADGVPALSLVRF